MPRFPYINFPFPFYKSSSRNPANYHNPQYSSKSNLNSSMVVHNSGSANLGINIQNSQISNKIEDSQNSRNANEVENTRILHEKNKSNKNNNDFLFDLFGLKIYSDDILLVSLIYFLYSEGVKDDGLFIVLILLLLS